ncbi:hypothetical protein KQI65_14685 [bacterium]|nr:hypothetical protein [bacterium]
MNVRALNTAKQLSAALAFVLVVVLVSGCSSSSDDVTASRQQDTPSLALRTPQPMMPQRLGGEDIKAPNLENVSNPPGYESGWHVQSISGEDTTFYKRDGDMIYYRFTVKSNRKITSYESHTVEDEK